MLERCEAALVQLLKLHELRKCDDASANANKATSRAAQQ